MHLSLKNKQDILGTEQFISNLGKINFQFWVNLVPKKDLVCLSEQDLQHCSVQLAH